MCMLTIVCQTDNVINWLYITKTVTIPDWLISISCYYYSGVVLIIALFRISEPIVWYSFKQDVAWLFCRKNLSKEQLFLRKGEYNSNNNTLDSDLLNDTLNVFLTSSLNVELVYTILTGIRKLVMFEDSQIS